MALGSGSITVAMTSIASSLGNRSFPQLSGRHMALHFFAVNQRHELSGHFSRWRPAIDPMKASGLLVVFGKRIGLGAIVYEPLFNLLFDVIRTMNEYRAALVADPDNFGHP